MAFLESDPTDWIVAEIDDAPVGLESAPTDWIIATIDPGGGWEESDPTDWIIAQIGYDNPDESDPTDWIIAEIAAGPPTSGVYMVGGDGELVEVLAFSPDEL